MYMPKLFADFMNADPAGNVRLNTHGTFEDLARYSLQLTEGLAVVISDGDIVADAVVHFSAAENIWVAAIAWDAVRPSAAAAVPAYNSVTGPHPGPRPGVGAA